MLIRNMLLRFGGYQEEAQSAEAPAGGAAQEDVVTQPVTEPVVEPVKEPASEPVQEPAQEPVDQPAQEVNTFLEAAEVMFKDAGMNGQAVVDFYEQNGSFDPEHLKVLEEKLGKAQTMLLTQGIENAVTAYRDSVVQETNAIYEAVGGQENFQAAADWAATEESGFEQHERDDINKMLREGGNLAKWAAQLLYIGYTNAGGEAAMPISGEAKLMEGQTHRHQTVKPISLQEYNSGLRNAKTQSEADELVKRANYTRSLPNGHELGWKWS